MMIRTGRSFIAAPTRKQPPKSSGFRMAASYPSHQKTIPANKTAMAIRYRTELIDFRGSIRYPSFGRALPVSDRHASTLAQEDMRETLLYLYSSSTTIHLIAIVALPISLYWLTSSKSSKTTGIIGLSLLTSFFVLMCFIPFVIPENHKYFIFPNVIYAGICAIALLVKLAPFATASPPKQAANKTRLDNSLPRCESK